MAEPVERTELIAAERQRQVEVKGYTAEHDAEHAEQRGWRYPSLVRAALTYLRQEPWHWPWDMRFYKPSPDDRVRELVKAGALVAAEIDRIQSAAGWITCPQCGVRRVLAGGCATRECIGVGL